MSSAADTTHPRPGNLSAQLVSPMDANPYGHPWPAEAAVGLATRVDLLTVIAHEIGHVLGHVHSTDVHSLTAVTLPVGTRRLPDGAT